MARRSYKNIQEALEFINEVFVPISPLVCDNLIPYYMVSNWGRIYSLASNRFLHFGIDDDGYYVTTLHTYTNNNLSRNCSTGQITRRVNRIVLLSFVPIQNADQMIAHHVNHNRMDNRLINLMWVTDKENQQYSLECGYRRFVDISGMKNPMAKLTDDQVIEIKDKIRSKQYYLAEIARQYNISMGMLYNLMHNVTFVGVGGYITEDDIQVTDAITDDEFNAICYWLQSHDINNRELYPSMNKLLEAFYYELGLDQKYGPMENKRKMLVNILRKSSRRHGRITSKYNYTYNY